MANRHTPQYANTGQAAAIKENLPITSLIWSFSNAAEHKAKQKKKCMPIRPFHLAFPVHDIATAREFWGGLIGCPEGRSAPEWIDFDFYGHQIVAHLVPGLKEDVRGNAVDGHLVPVPHFGIVLEMVDWRALADRLIAAGLPFEIEPHIRFEGEPGEQATMFFRDPSGNAIEMKAFQDLGQLFAT